MLSVPLRSDNIMQAPVLTQDDDEDEMFMLVGDDHNQITIEEEEDKDACTAGPEEAIRGRGQ